MRPVVVVMVKAPRAGSVKTRLTPSLSADESAALAACFARDVVGSAGRAADDLIIAYDPPGGRPALESLLRGDLLRRDLLWLEQRGADLGERIERAAAHAFGLGFGPVLFIGADSPTLPPSFITAAIQSLAGAEADIALGPTEDGGYYLVGLRRPVSGLFENVAWSTPRARAQTARNAARLGLRLLELPRWYDVDTPADLLRLRAEIFADDEARRRAPATFNWLRERSDGRS